MDGRVEGLALGDTVEKQGTVFTGEGVTPNHVQISNSPHLMVAQKEPWTGVLTGWCLVLLLKNRVQQFLKAPNPV